MTDSSSDRPVRPTADLGPRRRAALLIAASPAPAGEEWSRLATALTAVLPAGWHVAIAVREDPSAIAAAVRAIVAHGTDDLVVVPLDPAYSTARTGVILQDLYEALRQEREHISVAVRTTWYDDAGYVNALARYLAAPDSPLALHGGDAHLRFVAPTLPGPNGRPDALYARQVRRTVELVVARLGWPAGRWSLAFEPVSSMARAAPRRPDPDRGTPAHHTVVCQLPFPAETDGDGSESRAHTCSPLWSTDPFIGALRGVLLHGPQRARGGERVRSPLLPVACGSDANTEPVAELVMVGASVTNGLGFGRGPIQRSSEPGALALVKQRTRKALRAMLDWTREQTPLREAFAWNTCQRIELYGWLPVTEDAAARACLIGRIRHALFGAAPPPGLRVNVLAGPEARHHLMRTACGLNSALPGDRDVVAQLQTACRIAQCAHTAGARATALVDAATILARDVGIHTTWGRYRAGYCAAALARICEVDGVRPDRFHHVVIGGSTTSRSILSTLAEEHDVPHRQMTLVYRDHHGQMRQLRAALGGGRRVRVHAYDEESVLRAIANADFVFFGIDQAEPVLDATALLGLRDYGVRPLTLVDFNTFGSVAGQECLGAIALWSAKELDQAVVAQAAVTSSRSGFAAALAEAESWIIRCLDAESELQDPVPTARDVGMGS